jgi:hypothetical protein
MATIDDVVSNIKNGVLNLSQFVSGTTSSILQAFAAPGRFAQNGTSPVATLQTAIGTSGLLIVPFRASRRAISFFNSNTSNTTIWVSPLAMSTAGLGVPIAAGSSYTITPDLCSNCGWTAIAATGTTNTMLILEFV